MKEQELISAMDTIAPAPGLDQRILNNVTTPVGAAICRPKKHRTLRRTAAALVAAVMVLTAGAFASNPEMLRISGSNSEAPDYTTLPTEAQCVRDVGFAPQLLQTFDNGYTFKDGNIISNRLETTDGKTVSRYQSLSLTYAKDSDTVDYVSCRTLSTNSSDFPVIAMVGDVELMYNSYTNKLVPENYKLTEADKAAQAEGLVFSWGGDTIEVHEVQSLFWEQDGLRHALLQTDSTLTPEELVIMAEALITE